MPATKSVQEIINELYSTEGLSVQDILNAVFASGEVGADAIAALQAAVDGKEASGTAAGAVTTHEADFAHADIATTKAKIPARLYVVGPGLEYTTVDAAVTAAAMGDTPAIVLVSPGVDLTYTPTEGVRVIPLQMLLQEGYRRANLRGLPGMIDAQPMFDLPATGGLIALRIDDGSDTLRKTNFNYTRPGGSTITTANQFGGGVSFYDYCRKQGLCATMAVPPDLVGTADHLTADQIVQMFLQGGWEIAAHTFTHSTSPASFEDMITETVGAKIALEAMVRTAEEVGVGKPIVRGWIQSGAWTNAAYLDTLTKANGTLGDLIRSAYEWSQAYVGKGAWPHFTTADYGLDSQDQTTDAYVAAAKTAITQRLEAAAHPGRRTVFMLHKIGQYTAGDHYSTDLEVAKHIVDEIVRLRKAGRLQDVTLTGWHQGLMQRPQVGTIAAANAVLPVRMGGVTNGYLDDVFGDGIPIPFGVNSWGGWYITASPKQGDDPTDYTTFVASDCDIPKHPLITGAKALQLIRAEHGGPGYVRFIKEVEAGAVYELSFDAHVESGNPDPYLKIEWYIDTNAGGGLSSGSPIYEIILPTGADLTANGWATITHKFGVPADCAGRVVINFTLANVLANYGTLQLANFECPRVG